VLIGLRFDPALSEVAYIGWYFLPFPLLAGFSIFFLYKQKIEPTISTILLAGMVTGFIFFRFAFPVIDRQNPVSKSTDLIDDNEVRYFQKFNSAFVFKLQREIPELKENDIEAFFQQYPGGVIISTEKKVKQIELPANAEISFRAHDVFETPTTVLITRKK